MFSKIQNIKKCSATVSNIKKLLFFNVYITYRTLWDMNTIYCFNINCITHFTDKINIYNIKGISLLFFLFKDFLPHLKYK